MNYFLSMKIDDNNNGIPLMSEHSNSVVNLVVLAENMFELLTRHKSWDRSVVGNDFESHKMSDAAVKVIDNDLTEFEWSFPDKYDRTIRCYITRNV